MYVRFLLSIIGLLLGMMTNASAQFFGEVATETETVGNVQLAKPISLLEETENRATEDNTAEAAEIEIGDPDVSYYVQNLNLSDEQLAEIQKISAKTVAAQEEILQKIEALRQEIRSLEVSSLKAFEAVLDDTQKAAFTELRAGYEAAQKGAKAVDNEAENNAAGGEDTE